MHLIQRILSVGAAFGAFAFVISAASAQTPSTLEVVKKRGQLICGVNVGLGGFSLPDTQGTTHEFNMASWFRGRGMTIKPVVYESQDLMYEAFFGGRCDAMTQDSSALASALATRGKQADYMVLPDIISKEPLGPFVRRGDDVWMTVVRWSLFAMLEAEERGITTANVDEQLKSTDALVQRFLAVKPGNGKALQLDENWAYNIVKQVGNYGESYERNA